jgi:hypothetical protein
MLMKNCPCLLHCGWGLNQLQILSPFTKCRCQLSCRWVNRCILPEANTRLVQQGRAHYNVLFTLASPAMMQQESHEPIRVIFEVKSYEQVSFRYRMTKEFHYILYLPFSRYIVFPNQLPLLILPPDTLFSTIHTHLFLNSSKNTAQHGSSSQSGWLGFFWCVVSFHHCFRCMFHTSLTDFNPLLSFANES